jgi:hypothetical protein
MTSQGQAEFCIDVSVIRDLCDAIGNAEATIRARAAHEVEPPSFSQNQWVAADEFLAAFRHLRLREGARLVCVFSAWERERQSRLLICKLPSQGSAGTTALPPIPDALKDLEMHVFFRRDRKPYNLPDWVEWDVLPFVEDDGTPQAVFERSICHRWVCELLNVGHGRCWPSYTIIAELTDWTRDIIDRANAANAEIADLPRKLFGQANPDENSRPKTIELPEDCRPRVVHRVSASDPQAELPRAEENRAKLDGKDFSTVTFYSHYACHGRQFLYRHKDWFVGAEWACSELETLVDCC